MTYWTRIAMALAMLGGLALLACLASCQRTDYESDPPREQIRECYDAGKRAVMYNDGAIECRE